MRRPRTRRAFELPLSGPCQEATEKLDSVSAHSYVRRQQVSIQDRLAAHHVSSTDHLGAVKALPGREVDDLLGGSSSDLIHRAGCLVKGLKEAAATSRGLIAVTSGAWRPRMEVVPVGLS